MEVLNKILSLIQMKGIKDKDFLDDVGLNLTLLSDWKAGRNKSYLKHINKIAAYFDVSTDYLLGNTSTKALPEDLEQLISLYSELSKEDKEQAIRYIRLLKLDGKDKQ
ncbi:MAG: hypothetical protein BGN88_06535 [Clostridiales bacterium 43-6]|nr:MAG: hypothetical protein BGN88_06535 [Clostridiales bacterium 43-6]